MAFKIVEIKTDHITSIAQLHLKAFPDFFLTFLGAGFLEIFYKSFVYDEQGIGFVAIENNEIVGVIVGPFNPSGYFRRLLIKKWYTFCLASIGAVIKKPKIIKRLSRAVFYRGDSPANEQLSLLSSIAVSPDSQGKGVGKALVSAWLEKIKSRGGKGAFLTKDKENNNSVNSFYQKIGWKLESTYQTPEGRKMNRYVFYFNTLENK